MNYFTSVTIGGDNPGARYVLVLQRAPRIARRVFCPLGRFRMRGPSVRALLVEDDPDLAEVTAEFLSQEGLVVRTALSGREALEIASAFGPQLVLCDLNLPDTNGVELARKLRSSASTSRSYIVILTAMGGMTAHELDVDAFISKPITTEAVRTLVEKLAR